MNRIYPSVLGLILYTLSSLSQAALDKIQLAVWTNEAIIATYTFNYQTFIQEQKKIATYFSAEGWIAYTKALNASGLPAAVQKNAYDVTAVATQPPVVISIDSSHWKATMPILVNYKNPQYQQQQNLDVSIEFSIAPADQGVRGLTISKLQSIVSTAPCLCAKSNSHSIAKDTKQ